MSKENIFKQGELIQHVFDLEAQPYIKRGMDILNKYADVHSNTCGQTCKVYYEILNHDYTVEPNKTVEEKEIRGLSIRVATNFIFIRTYAYMHNLIIKFGILYSHRGSSSAEFSWMSGNDYYRGIDRCFLEEFGNIYQGFSTPKFEGEENCDMLNHEQTFRQECILDFSTEIPEFEFHDVAEKIEMTRK